MSIDIKFPAIEGEMDYEWRFECNQKPTNWRERLAAWMRDKAMRLDGQYTLAISIRSNPKLTVIEHAECVRTGLLAMERAVMNSVLAAAEEDLLRKARPELYVPERTGR